jgi:hypothetical protein
MIYRTFLLTLIILRTKDRVLTVMIMNEIKILHLKLFNELNHRQIDKLDTLFRAVFSSDYTSYQIIFYATLSNVSQQIAPIYLDILLTSQKLTRYSIHDSYYSHLLVFKSYLIIKAYKA